MTSYRFAIIPSLLFTIASAYAQVTWKQVSSFSFDWNQHKRVQVVLEIPAKWDDPGDFTRIRINVPGQKKLVLTNPSGWVKYGSEAFNSSPKIQKANLLHTNFVVALKAAENRTLLFLFGYSYASSPGSLDVLEISESGEPRVVLHRDELGLRELRDLDGDGVAEIVGYPCLSQQWGNGLSTYDPFNVYKLAALTSGTTNLSLPLSKNYNLKHYYGWAGPKCSEEFAVVLHPPNGGKPIVMRAKDAEKLTASVP